MCQVILTTAQSSSTEGIAVSPGYWEMLEDATSHRIPRRIGKNSSPKFYVRFQARQSAQHSPVAGPWLKSIARGWLEVRLKISQY